MTTQIRLMPLVQDTAFAPLGLVGYCLTRTNFLAPAFAELHLALKQVDYSPVAKLEDVLCSILTGCRAIAQVNTRLCPDRALARAWGRERFAEQSTLARTLDAFTASEVAQLRQGSATLFRRHSRTWRHDFAADWLWLDIDLTPLPASKHAEASTKGKIGGEKTATGGNWPGCRRRSTRKRCFRTCIPARSTAVRPSSRCSWHLSSVSG